MEKFFLTTPIYYINDVPHVGHTYTTIAADTIARYHRLQGHKTMLSTGVDANSQKTVEAAAKLGEKDVSAYAEKMAKTWQQTWYQLEVQYDDFISTTEPRHLKAVKAFFDLVKKEDIYKGTYEGLYCVGHEAFIKEDELVDGKCAEHNRVPDKVKEENYFFKLSNYQKPLLEYIKQNPNFVMPESRRNEIVAFIERGLEDFSISRQKKGWGIPYPGDESQVLYVWFDALVNYLTVTGFPDKKYGDFWPADLHLIGKDIIRFHCVYWPAMLMSAGLPLPKTVFANGYFTIDGQKISKSLGNAISPIELAKQYGIDALRYYLLREIPFGADGDFNHARLEAIYNSELANDLGNAVQRSAKMVEQYFGGEVGNIGPSVHDSVNYHTAMSEFKLDKALNEVRELVRGLNQYIDEMQPWKLAKTDEAQLKEVLGHAMSDIIQISTLIEPFMPQTALKIKHIFRGPKVDLSVGVLFPKKDSDVKQP